MLRAIPTFFTVFILTFSAHTLRAESVTIATGETFVATFDLSNYVIVCETQSCPTFPTEVAPLVYTAVPLNTPDHYSLQAFVESTNDGQEFPIGSLPLGIAVDAGGEPQFGLFSMGGVDFPNDPTFWGPDPGTDTFRLVFTNTGDPFTLLNDPALGFVTLEDAVAADVGTVGVAEGAIGISLVPEPEGLAAILSIALMGLAVFKKLKLNC
jgi:hypothetical protein